ncbi:MAG: NAD-dependent protein deacetylase [Armatimonadetes bacterium]|nr:NAD-dependent protein deacetylase [Armatimonadota bacterium]
MGVDSGLPDFRGDRGFWKAYPPYQRLGMSFVDMANPQWFHRDPEMAWGFYGHRRNLYRSTTPHRGFQILRRWAERMPLGVFIFTSNVDDHFGKAGFDSDQIVECHGALEWNQCLARCTDEVFLAGPEILAIDLETMRARPPLPACPNCGSLARPNVLMFGDGDWRPARQAQQSWRLRWWLERAAGLPGVIVECGAGAAIPTVRYFCERESDREMPLVRINPRDPQVPDGHISLAAGALEALDAIDRALAASTGPGPGPRDR